MTFPLPDSYAEWRHCIVAVCGLPLTHAFIHERLAALDDPHDHMTRTFIALYGEAHWLRTKDWFQQALTDDRAPNAV